MKKNIKLYTIIISVSVHIILFLLTDSVIKLKLFGIVPENPDIKNSNPIVFDLSEPRQKKSVIESPNLKEEKVKNAEYLSDKSLNARNNDSSKKAAIDKPYSKGDIEAPLIPGISSAKNLNKREKDNPGETEFKEKKEIIAEDPHPKKEKLKGLYDFRASDELLSKNIESKVRKQGGFSFSTYNWNFAPYMLEMKRKIQNNIYPPLAFKTLGLIDGETLVKFTIQKDGSLSDVKLLNYKGHKSLMETSIQAIKISAPFRELPEDFPDPYLVVTGKFIYFVRR